MPNYTLDGFAIFIFLGIAQALFLSVFFLYHPHRPHNRFQALFLLALALCLLEILLMYTGYIRHVLWLTDFSEPIAFLLGPFAYLTVYSLVHGRPKRRQVMVHLIVPIIYTLLFLPYLLESEDIKYNSWMCAYHPGMPLRPAHSHLIPAWYRFDGLHTRLVVTHLVMYGILCGLFIRRTFRQKGESFRHPVTPALRTIRSTSLMLIVMTMVVIAVKIVYTQDTGDQYIAGCASLAIYFISFSVMRRSSFFEQVPLTEHGTKAKASALADDDRQRVVAALDQSMRDKRFADHDLTVARLAKQVGIPPYVLSQVINEHFQMGFFEWIAGHRIAEAQRLLTVSPQLKIEEIADAVGYHSKSSFNTAFKKITGLTPSVYRSQGQEKGIGRSTL